MYKKPFFSLFYNSFFDDLEATLLKPQLLSKKRSKDVHFVVSLNTAELMGASLCIKHVYIGKLESVFVL